MAWGAGLKKVFVSSSRLNWPASKRHLEQSQLGFGGFTGRKLRLARMPTHHVRPGTRTDIPVPLNSVLLFRGRRGEPVKVPFGSNGARGRGRHRKTKQHGRRLCLRRRLIGPRRQCGRCQGGRRGYWGRWRGRRRRRACLNCQPRRQNQQCHRLHDSMSDDVRNCQCPSPRMTKRRTNPILPVIRG